MTLPRTVAEVLSEHVVFEVECIDRMYLNVYVPQLQFALGLVGYVHRQLGLPVASTAPLATITDRFAAAVHRFAADERIPWVDFAKGQRKDDVMHEHLAAFEAAGRTEGVLRPDPHAGPRGHPGRQAPRATRSRRTRSP